MKEYLEKELDRYVIATLDNPTNYLVAKGNCSYSFIDNIQVATKFVSVDDAREIYNSCMSAFNFDMVIVPIKIKYVLIDKDGE